MTSPLDRTVVTGAGGFVGRSLLAHLESPPALLHLQEEDWREQVAAADFRNATVFHLAARAEGEEADLVRDNVDKSRALAQAAAERGARRLVFASSVKVNGEETLAKPFRASDPPAPQDAYARSKWAAEQALTEIARAGGLEFVIVRPPLIYGPDVKGNLRALVRLADSPWLLPFGAIDNRRSFLHVDDLARVLVECATLPQAAGGTFMAAHEATISTPRLIATMRHHLGRPRRMVRIPRAALEAAAGIAGQGARMRRLTRSLEVDAAETRKALGWTAQIGVETAIEDMVRAYREADL